MKKTLFLMMAAFTVLAVSTPAQAARQYPSVEAAKQKVTDDGYILFIYPEGWDRYSEKFCKKLIADDGVQEAAGNAALILAPIYQNRNEKNNAHVKSVVAPLGYPGDMSDISYPALVFYEKGGRSYATLHGEALMNSSAAEVAALVKGKMAAKKKQDDLLAKANASSDAGEKNRLLLESSRVDGIEWPGGLRDAMRRNDPEDKHGYLGILNFGFGRGKDEAMPDYLARLDKVLDNPQLSPWQKQRACADAIGQIRRSYGPLAGGTLITKYAKKMQKLDPESPLGLSAPVVMRDWVKTYRYGQGWSDQIIPSVPEPMLMHDVPITKPGTYAIHFKLTTGRDGIIVKRLRLMDGKKCVASHDEPCEVSWAAGTEKDITFTVKKDLKKPCLEITYGNDPGKRSTWGEITVIPR